MEVRSYRPSLLSLQASQSSDYDDDDLRGYLLKAVDEDEQNDEGKQKMLRYAPYEGSFFTSKVIQLKKNITCLLCH